MFIRGARRLGLRLAEIRDLVKVRDAGTCPCGPAEALLREHVIEIDREIARLSALRAELTTTLAGLSDPRPRPRNLVCAAAHRRGHRQDPSHGEGR
jgi:DNA-binding transcriptional MerR regulator